ncbi:MAG: anti-sigma factor [Ignavibacteriales bacterium]|nr:MAG: anti-sigma factor [Ignavibacteriales bacterium]
MADKALSEMIAAFAAGCMDKQNYMQFKDYMDESGYLPKGELGELQNIISMIPVILDLEKPDPSIKDLVAKKLIGMKEEIKTRIIEEKKKTTAAATKLSKSSINSPKNKTISFIDRKALTTTSAYQFGDDDAQIPIPQRKTKTPIPEPKTPTAEPKKIESPGKTATPKPIIAPPQLIAQTIAEEPTSQEKTSSGIMGLAALLLSIVLFSILGYYTFTSIKTLNGTVDDLTAQVNSLKNQLGTANNFISNYTFLIEFFNYKDIIVTGLSSSDAAEKGSAQLLLSFNQKEGLIQFKNVKPLQPNQGYQVWVQSKGQAYSLGVYQPSGSEYLKISSFPFLPKENIESYFVTIESNEGSPTPSTIIYLSSSTTGKILKGRAN